MYMNEISLQFFPSWKIIVKFGYAYLIKGGWKESHFFYFLEGFV